MATGECIVFIQQHHEEDVMVFAVMVVMVMVVMVMVVMIMIVKGMVVMAMFIIMKRELFVKSRMFSSILSEPPIPSSGSRLFLAGGLLIGWMHY